MTNLKRFFAPLRQTLLLKTTQYKTYELVSCLTGSGRHKPLSFIKVEPEYWRNLVGTCGLS